MGKMTLKETMEEMRKIDEEDVKLLRNLDDLTNLADVLRKIRGRAKSYLELENHGNSC